MPIIKTDKHEMEYDTETKQAIFNGRNRTALMPTTDPFPARMIGKAEQQQPSDQLYIIGFSGMSQSDPALTRTDSAEGAEWAASNGAIEVTGIDISKIWGGYIGNDGESLEWNGTDFLKDGVAYGGNVFSKINRFFTKASYANGVLDGYQLCFAESAPDDTWQDWFYGKDHIAIGCYKGKNITSSSPLRSVRGIAYSSSITANANDIVAAYKRNSSANGNLHEKWFNENAILQVLFMAIFATRQTETVFPQGTYRNHSDSKPTGYLDGMRTSSSIATGYSVSGASGENGNMFLGIEDFVGFGYELVAGVKLSGSIIDTTMDYANFSYVGAYPTASIKLPSSSNYISELQEDADVAGLLVPKSASGDSSSTYFCDYIWVGGTCWYQGATSPYDFYGLFCFLGHNGSSFYSSAVSARLCRTPI